MIFVLLIRTFFFFHVWGFEFVSVFMMLYHYMLFYGTPVGKVVGKATRERSCCMTNVGVRSYVFSEISSVSSTEKDIDTRLMDSDWTAIDRLSIIWKSDPTDKMKCSFFLAAVVSILLYGFTTRTLTKRLEKKLDGNYTRMLRAILNKSWRQHPTRHQLYGHLPPITKTIQIRRTRHAGHCWRSRDELIIDVLLWTPTYGQAKAGRPART